jgi:hypothetical protein
MGWTDIHGYDRNTYCLALALCKIQFEETWYLLKLEKEESMKRKQFVLFAISGLFILHIVFPGGTAGMAQAF